MRGSRSNLSRSSEPAFSSWSILSATCRESRGSAASYTTPMPPAPILRRRVKRPNARGSGRTSVLGRLASDPSSGSGGPGTTIVTSPESAVGVVSVPKSRPGASHVGQRSLGERPGGQGVPHTAQVLSRLAISGPSLGFQSTSLEGTAMQRSHFRRRSVPSSWRAFSMVNGNTMTHWQLCSRNVIRNSRLSRIFRSRPRYARGWKFRVLPWFSRETEISNEAHGSFDRHSRTEGITYRLGHPGGAHGRLHHGGAGPGRLPFHGHPGGLRRTS